MPGGTDAHPAAADRAEDWSAGEPASFLPWLQKSLPKRPICLCFGFSFSISACSLPPAPPPTFWSIANSLSFSYKFCYLFSSYCAAVLTYERTSEIALPFLWDCLQVSPLTFIPSSSLPPIPVWLQVVLSPKKEKPDTVEDPKPGMSLICLSCLLVKLQSFLY